MRDRRLVSGTVFVRLLSDDDHGDRLRRPLRSASRAVRLSRDRSRRAYFARLPGAQANQVYANYNGAGLVQGRPMTRGLSGLTLGSDHYRHDGQSSDAVLEVSGSAHDFDLMIMEHRARGPR